MGKLRGPYQEEYPAGSRVRIASRSDLQAFQAQWKHHHPLADVQLDYGGLSAEVLSVSFYHGGDEIYSLKGIPGLWHEACLIAE